VAFTKESLNTSISIVVGTRPEIIKMAPIVKICEELDLPHEIIHTGQHYSYELDSLIVGELNLPAPDYNLNIGSGSHAEETARALVGLETIFRTTQPSIVLVQGDTNSTLAGALAATKMHIPVGHVEAGLRSFDRQMPEETNRILTDHISDHLFAPTERSSKNLLAEGIDAHKITITGNTIVDVINLGLESGARGRTYPDDDFLLLTLHREENVDVEQKLRNILRGVDGIARKYDLRVRFPAHPRTSKRLKEYDISVPDRFVVTPPVGYIEFLRLEQSARMILTDSGGVQEEACVLGTPCVTLRTNTERPETIEVGANYLAGLQPDKMVLGADKMMKSSRSWINPFGDGRASGRIVKAITRMNGKMIE